LSVERRKVSALIFRTRFSNSDLGVFSPDKIYKASILLGVIYCTADCKHSLVVHTFLILNVLFGEVGVSFPYASIAGCK